MNDEGFPARVPDTPRRSPFYPHFALRVQVPPMVVVEVG